jgi:hypothetical protein
MKPDLRNVTAIVCDHRNPRAAVKMLAAHSDALDLGDLKYLNLADGYPQCAYWNNYEVWKYVKTDFALMLQLDGYVINPELWDPAFLRFDYIGAPWPAHFEAHDTGRRRVGNDGFCIKSRRLMDRVARLPWKDVPSDVLVCCTHRDRLEDEGFRFAPPAIAGRFSVEHIVEETAKRTFGFHGRCFPTRDDPLPIWHADRAKI